MIGIVDYGVGNVGSIRNALTYLKIPFVLSRNSGELSRCYGLILPGVGAFHPAMEKLESLGLASFLHNWAMEGGSVMGICLGMQLIMTESEENGRYRGLDLISGSVTKLKDAPRSIHIGWNKVIPRKTNMFLPTEGFAYFVHSYACRPEDSSCIVGETVYGETFASMVQSRNVIGVQFHPEKSQTFGLNMLKRFADELV